MTAPNPVASFPATDVDVRYRMGPLFTETPGVDYWWNTQDDDGTYTVVGEPEGWESVDYILPLDQVGGRDGAHVGPQSLGPRRLECSALIVSPTAHALRLHLQRLRRIFGPQGNTGTRQPIIWEQHDYLTGLRLALITRPEGRFDARVLGGPSKGGNAAQIRFTLVATSPTTKFQSGATQSSEIGLLDAGAVTGRTYDLTYNWTYGAGGSNPGGEMVVLNNGDTLAWPVFYILGPADWPIISNPTTGREFQLMYNVAAGETVSINSASGEVDPRTVRLDGHPFPLVSGPNTIRWRTQSGAYNADARLRMEWRSTFS